MVWQCPGRIPDPVPSPVDPAKKLNPVPKPSLRAVITYRPVPWEEKLSNKQFDSPANLHTTPYELTSPITTISGNWRHYFEYSEVGVWKFIDADGNQVNKCGRDPVETV